MVGTAVYVNDICANRCSTPAPVGASAPARRIATCPTYPTVNRVGRIGIDETTVEYAGFAQVVRDSDVHDARLACGGRRSGDRRG